MVCSQYSCSLGCYFITQQLFEIKKGCLNIFQTKKSEGFCFGKRFFDFLLQFCLHCLVSRSILLSNPVCINDRPTGGFLQVADVKKYLSSHINIIALTILMYPVSSNCVVVLKLVHVTSYGKSYSFARQNMILLFLLSRSS